MPEAPDTNAGVPATRIHGDWNASADMIEVVRSPAPGPARGTWRAFVETARGLRTTFGRMLEGTTTIQYPEEKVPVFPRFRGRHKLHRFEDTGLEKCVGLLAVRGGVPRRLHPRRGRREHAGEPRFRRRALRGGV